MDQLDRTKLMSVDEVAKIVRYHRSRFGDRSRNHLAIVRLAACCGLRASEIGALQVGDVIAGEGITRPYIHVRRSLKSKRPRPRRVPLWWDGGTLADLVAHVAWRRSQGAGDTDPLVATASGLPMDRRNLRTAFRAAARRPLGVARAKTLTIHHGRHSFCSNSLLAGRSLMDVRDAAGHSNVSITSVYLHAGGDDGTVGSIYPTE